MLSEINYNPRDDNIVFIEEGHLYNIVGLEGHPTSVTTLIKKFENHFDEEKVLDKMFAKGPENLNPKYKGMTREQIKEQWAATKKLTETASSLGTFMHKEIENYLNGLDVEDPERREFKLFLEFWAYLKEKYPTWKLYRLEYLVYDEDIRLAGSIDCLLEDENGNIIILDWKRSKEIKKENSFVNRFGDKCHTKMKFPFNQFDDCNLYHYSLQLNFYRHILENKYGKKVIDMRLIILHPDQEKFDQKFVSRIDLSKVWHTLNS